MSISNSIKTADFKAEKHVPVIKVLSKEGENVIVEVSVGAEIAHPNTTEHFISYIDLYYKGEAAIQHIGRAEFLSHGESAQGANQGAVHTEPVAVFKCIVAKPGVLHAVSYCNIHGLWESELAI